MHRGVVSHQDHNTTVYTRHAAVNEGIGTDVQTHVLHTNQSTLAHVGHTQGGLHSRLLIGTPATMNLTLLSQLITLYKFRDFR